MPAETDLQKLISSMTPSVSGEEYVFISLSDNERSQLEVTPVLEFREAEGVTLVISRTQAEQAALLYEFPSRMITLNVHSSLSAVGFLAAITDRLAKAGISVNAVSAFYHDHLFVPAGRAEEAMAILNMLAAEYS